MHASPDKQTRKQKCGCARACASRGHDHRVDGASCVCVLVVVDREWK